MKLVHCSWLSNTEQGNTCSLRRNPLLLLLYALFHFSCFSIPPPHWIFQILYKSLPLSFMQSPDTSGRGGATCLCWPKQLSLRHTLSLSVSLCPFPSYRTTFLVFMFRAKVWDVHLNQCLVSLCYIFDQCGIYCCGQQVLGMCFSGENVII